MTANQRVAAAIAGALRDEGTAVIFGVPGGGSNLDLIGAAESAGCRFVLTRTETAAVIMAAVVAEISGTPAAAVVTRGPGAASAVNGVAHALLDRQPVILITDGVSSADRARVSHQRIDQGRMLDAVTKASVVVGPEDADAVARTAIRLARSGRPGPVHLDMDATASGAAVVPDESVRPLDRAALDTARALLRAARHPVVIAGVGALGGQDRTVAALRRFVEPAAIPTLTTYKARGMLGDSSPAAAGVATGATIEGPLLHGADLIIGVGFDPVELIPGLWPYSAPVVLLGAWPTDDSTYFGANMAADVVGDIPELLDTLAGDITSAHEPATAAKLRAAALTAILGAVPDTAASGLLPQQVVTVARDLAPPGTIATVDAGAHMLPAVPLWEVESPGELLISSGLATMGFALPAAIAAGLASPGRRVVCFTGDGGLGMVLGELETLARLDLPVVVVVFDDAALSLIAIKQRAEGQGGDNAVRYSPVDFAAVAAAAGLASARAGDMEAYRTALRAAYARPGPTLVDVTVDPAAYPAILQAIRG